MAFIPLPFGIKVTVEWETGSGIAVCVHFVSKTSPVAVNTADLLAALTHFETWGQAIRSVQGPQIIRAGLRATDWSAPDGASLLFIPTTNTVGTSAAPTLPLNVAVCVTHVSGLTGRSRRGRNYIPGIAEDKVNPGDLITSSARTTLASAYSALRTNLLGNGLVQVVASFHSGGVARVTGQGTAIQLSTVDPWSDSMRGRLANRGA